MNLELFLNITAIVFAGGLAWGLVKKGMDTFEKRFDAHEKDVWREVGKLRDWRHVHQEEAANERLKIHEKVSDIAVQVARNDEKFTAIMDAITEIREDIKGLRK